MAASFDRMPPGWAGAFQRIIEVCAPEIGRAFEPVATALGTCMATTMGIVARRHGWDLRGTTVTVVKKMVSQPLRRIGELEVVIRIPGEHDERARKTLETTALTCPVHKSLHPDVALPVRIEWTGAARV